MKFRASIVVLTYNNLDYTRMCLESIYAKTTGPDFELILVDNASSDGTPRFLEQYGRQHPNLQVILNDTNQGFARGNNMGAAIASGEIIVFLNNDTVVTEGWLSGLIRHLQDPSVGMVGPVTNSSGNESRIEVGYENLDDMDEFASQYTLDHQGQAFEIRMLPFQCVALRRSVFEEIGPLDESFGIGMFEDDDYALRLKEKGYKILCAEDVFIHHWGSASFAKLDTKQYWKIYQENLKKFEEKWGLTWFPHTLRPEFIPQQLRHMLDDSLWLREVLEERERTLSNIYASNGWAFLQFLLRVRRVIIPEGSRREALLSSVIAALRDFRPTRLRAIRDAIAATIGEAKKKSPARPVPLAAGESQGQPAAPSAGPSLVSVFPERFPWPKVSVILPVFNHADMVEAAARSVLLSTYPNFELIMIDDGSTDEIEPVLRRLANNPRVRIFRQPNQKLPRALTHAHQHVRGEFVTWTSSDNLFAPAAIEMMVNGLLAHPEAMMVYADVSLIDAQGSTLRKSDYRSQNQDPARPELIRLYRDDRPLGHEADNYINACFLYRREAAQALEGYFADDLRGLEDYDFWLRLQKTGRLHHLGNREPLYYYRVHARTMSHDLLSGDEARERHLKRKEDFIAYEARRREYTQKRWNLVIDASLSRGERESLARIAAQLPVDVDFDGGGWNSRTKMLPFLSPAADTSSPIFVRNFPQEWHLIWQSPRSKRQEGLKLCKGVSIHPLVLKAREHRKDPWEFPQVGDRSIIGCHLSLSGSSIDVRLTRRVIASNPDVFFVFIGESSGDRSSVGADIVKGLDNADYLGPRSQRESYHTYACFDAFWMPPASANSSKFIYLSQLALAYSAARPLLIPEGSSFDPAPYQYFYQPRDGSLNFASSLKKLSIDSTILNRYLDSWTPASRLLQLFRYADAITQEWALPRPDFAIEPLPVVAPTSWRPVASDNGKALKCALAVNSLDKGGLEQVVAQLARSLPECGINTSLICVESGGEIADRLKAEGIRVHSANRSGDRMRAILQKEKPDLLNSHWADIELLQAASELGIPIVETIHNMYVWMDDQAWEIERQRSRYFSHAVAVSQLVKAYYARFNYAFNPDWISVIPNGIDPSRIQVVDRAEARAQLQFPEDQFIFLNLSSYDGRKNHLGTMTAFDQVARDFPRARLLFAGNIAYPQYYAQIQAYRDKLRSRDKIYLYEFRQDKDLLLSAADAFVINSFYEGWSLAATEALQVGLPLIHSHCGSAAELVGENGERGIVVPNPACEPLDLHWDLYSKVVWQTRHRNTDELIEAMSQLLAKSSHWQKTRPAIRAYAHQKFSLESTLQSYARLFKEWTVIKEAP